MKRKHITLISLLIIAAWAVGYFNQYYRIPEVKIVEVEIEKIVTVTDTIYVDSIVEKKIYIPKYITEIKTDTLIKELIVEKPVEIIKTIYRDRPVDRIVEVMRPPQKKFFLGFGYQYDLDNYFSGSDIRFLYKAPGDKMFSLDVGFRNDLLDKETGVSKLRPYVGASIYFRLDKDKNQQLFILKANLTVKEEEVNLNKFLANNWSIVVGLLAFIFTAGTIFAQFTALQSELNTVHERLDKKIKVINELEDRIVDIEKELQYEKGFLEGKGK